MSDKENRLLEVLRQLADGMLSQREAGRRLDLSERQVSRLARCDAASGVVGLVGQNRLKR